MQMYAEQPVTTMYDSVAECSELTVRQVKILHLATTVLGHPTILINNAGSTGGQSGVKSVEDVSIDVFERTWRINCGSAYLLTQLCMPAMEEAGWGRVVFVSSVAGLTGGIIGPHYAYVWIYPYLVKEKWERGMDIVVKEDDDCRYDTDV
jgi:NAD(P)-dependent dehydrogenase (short-subunit alcohol dehydrogenase family)